MARAQTIAPNHCLHVRVAGWLPDDWSERFDGITQRYADDGSTVLCGELRDQCELFGVLRALESRGMKIIACVAYPGGVA